MTELSFLVDLLLNHKLPKVTRDAVAARIKEVEGRLAQAAASPAPVRNTFELRGIQTPAAVPPHMVGQSASTIAAMMRQESMAQQQQHVQPPRPDEQAIIDAQQEKPAPAPQPVAVVAQTPAAAAALADRQAAIAQQISGKPERGRTSPRKF